MTEPKPTARFKSAIEAAQRQRRNADDARFIPVHRAKFIALASANVRLALGAANQMRDRVRRDRCLRMLSQLRGRAARAQREAVEAARAPSRSE